VLCDFYRKKRKKSHIATLQHFKKNKLGFEEKIKDERLFKKKVAVQINKL